jgi:hypothetical protein
MTSTPEARATWHGAWVGAIAGVLAGAVGAGAVLGGTLIASDKARQQAHDQFIAERRQDVYAQYLENVGELSEQQARFRGSDGADVAADLWGRLSALEVDFDELQLVAGQGVEDDARKVADDLRGGAMAKLDQYCRANGGRESFCALAADADDSLMSTFDDDLEALVIIMRDELDVPA